MKMNDKKTKTIFIVLFIAFAVSSIIGATTGLIFLPFIVWIIFFVMIIKVGIKNTKGAKEKFKQIRKEFEEAIKETETDIEDKDEEDEEVDIYASAVKDDTYDKCDNEECDTHLESDNSKKCPLCLTLNDSSAKFCKVCGEELDKDIF